MRQQMLTCTALPNGVTGDGKLRLSVHLAPRLSSDEDGDTPLLSAFPDFVNFGTTARGMAFTVLFDGVAAVVGQLDPATPAPNNDLWKAIFPPTAEVRPFGMDTWSDRNIRSFPASNVKQFIQNLYTAVGLMSPPTFPTPAMLLADSALGQVASDPASGRDPLPAIYQELDRELTKQKAVSHQDYNPANIGKDLLQVGIFYTPRTDGTKPTPMDLPNFDFHNGLGLLGNHGRLLRLLGIVRDIVVPVPTNFSHATTVTVFPAWSPAYPISNGAVHPAHYTQVISPHVRFKPAGFMAAPRAARARLTGRRLNLADPRYDVVDFDVDGAALKSLNFASAIAHATSSIRSTPSTPTSFALPALRSEGLVLIEADKAATTQSDLKRQDFLNDQLMSGIAPTLDAEDLVRGYYVDVLDSTTNQWAPLCARNVTYNAVNYVPPPNSLPLIFEDEGPVTLAATDDGRGSPKPDILLREVVAKWSGWSVVAPRPGTPIDPNDDNGLQPAPDTSDSLSIKLGITTKTPQDLTRPKLPSLRFGRQYRLRARAADLAGNSEPFNLAPDTVGASVQVAYSRYEPVPPPVVLPHEDTTPGASTFRMVIRSDYNTAAATTAPTIRHLAPPNAGQLLIEQSGVLDVNGHVDGSLYGMLAMRDGQKFDNPTGDMANLNVKHVDPGAPKTGDGATQWVFPADFVNIPYLPDPFSSGCAFYDLPFGPSPALVAWNFPRVNGTFDTVLANRIRLLEPLNITTPAAYTPNPKGVKVQVPNVPGSFNGQLDVYLPKGSVAKIRVNSTLHGGLAGDTSPDGVIRMGVWQWFIKGLSGTALTKQAQTALKTLIANGGHWMVSPSHEITLVHAVRRPLLPPSWNTVKATRTDINGIPVNGTYADLTGDRQLGETILTFTGNCVISGRSTGRVQVEANWTEQIDTDPAGPTLASHQARPFSKIVDSQSFPIADANGKPLAVAANVLPLTPPIVRGVITGNHPTQDFHDHKHRVVHYTLEAMSSFAEEFIETTSAHFDLSGKIQIAPTALIGGYTTIVDAVTGTGYAPDRDFFINDPDGWITLPPDSPIPLFTQLTIKYLAGPVSRFSTEPLPPGAKPVLVVSRTADVNVLATARPAAPSIQYVLPAWDWSGWLTRSTKTANTRSGNTLRVWLDRPWYSSGDGEQLAVMCATGTLQPDAQDVDIPTAKKKVPNGRPDQVSLIGADPIWGAKPWKAEKNSFNPAVYSPSLPTSKILAPTDFPLAVRKITGDVTAPGSAVSLAAAVHDVAFDPSRRLWYCDIQIDPGAGAYTPFVQLALARFQLNAINDASGDVRLSPIVLAEIAQLSPERTITITTPSGLATDTITVGVSGTSYLSTGQIDLTSEGPSYVHPLAGPGLMECRVQTVIPGMDHLKYPDTAWQDAPGHPRFLLKGSIVASTALAQWTATTTLPFVRGTKAMRLAFVEYEQVNSAADALGRVVFAGTYEFPLNVVR